MDSRRSGFSRLRLRMQEEAGSLTDGRRTRGKKGKKSSQIKSPAKTKERGEDVCLRREIGGLFFFQGKERKEQTSF